jgi:two-component system phosphate regulon response regulator PhoB
LNHLQASTGPIETMNPALQRRVLIVEDDSEPVAELRAKLAQAGFKVSMSGKGEDACAAIDRDNPHLVVIDWDLPVVIAMGLIRHVRRDTLSKGPRVIALSAFAEEQHVVSGFEVGIDDYVVKPFSIAEVVARVRAVLRPMHGAREESQYLEFGELQMDATEGRVTIVDKAVSLRNMEFQLLQFLMRRPERACSRETLLDQVWGNDCRAGLRAVDVTVQRIRRALARHGCVNYLQTIRGVGYRLSVASTAR